MNEQDRPWLTEAPFKSNIDGAKNCLQRGFHSLPHTEFATQLLVMTFSQHKDAKPPAFSGHAWARTNKDVW
jgi:hypothetical protein